MLVGRLLKILLIFYNLSILAGLVVFFIWKDNSKSKRAIGFAKAGIFVLFCFLFAQFALYLDVQHIEPQWIQVKKVEVRNHDFPAEVSRLEIVQISDLHIKKHGFREHQMIKIINRLNPDLILITGDFITERKYLPELKEVVSKLKAKKGIFAVLGDNDFYAFGDILELKIALEKSGVNILYNQNVRIGLDNGKGLWLIGMTDNKLNPDTFARAYAGVNLTEPKILLTHYPEHVDSGLITEENADIVLSGGTHGGQVGLKFIRDFLAPSEKLEYVAGKYIVQGVTLYVNRGIGSVGDMQADTIRLFCRPEITEVAFSNK